MRERPILISESDVGRLRALLRGHGGEGIRDQEHLQELRSELERAVVVDASEIPPGVISMNSRAWVADLASSERREYMLVYPADADPAAGRVSVLAPLGTALLGYREGDEVEWLMPGGLRRLQIEMVFQPDAATGGQDARTTSFGSAVAGA